MHLYLHFELPWKKNPQKNGLPEIIWPLHNKARKPN